MLSKVLAILTTIILNSYVVSFPPLLSNFETPVLMPGESKEFSFTLKNRYVSAIYNVKLTGEIYCYLIDNISIEINKIQMPPKILETQSTSFTYYYSVIPPQYEIRISFHVEAYEKTPRGTYCIRFQLNFIYNESDYVMKSRGFFSKSLWERATSNFTINLSLLNVDGILPETSFVVEDDLSLLIISSFGIMLIALGILIARELLREKTGKFEENLAYIRGRLKTAFRKRNKRKN